MKSDESGYLKKMKRPKKGEKDLKGLRNIEKAGVGPKKIEVQRKVERFK